MRLEAPLRGRIEARLGEPLADYEPVHGGYTPAARWRVVCRSGASAFAKIGTTPLTASALRSEWDVYRQLEADFMPRVLGWDDHPEQPLLVLEDLSGCRWPPPWDAALVDAVLATLDRVHGTRAALPSLGERIGQPEAEIGGWAVVRADPAPFLGLGMASGAWLERCLGELVRAEGSVPTAGDAVTHFDVRSDNLCLTDRGVVLIDWNLACLGNPELDTAFWLPSLELEGGPAPETVLPQAPGCAAWVSGFFAARAGLPDIPDAPRVRRFQREQLAVALGWAIRALDLPPLD